MAAGSQVLQNLVVQLSMNATQYTRQMMVVNGMTRSLQAGMANFGSFLTRSVTVPIMIMGAVAVREFAKFDKAMVQSLSIMGNVAPALRQEMEAQAKFLSTEMVTSAEDLARAYYYLAQTGMDATAATAALDTVNKFSVAGMFDMAQATDLLTDAQTALGLTVKESAQANAVNLEYLGDILVKASMLANASTEQFSRALTTKAAAAMRFFNISVEEGVGVLAAYASQNLKAERGGTMYDRALRLLAKSAISNAKEHKILGFSVYDTTGAMRSMADIVDNLDAIMLGLTDEQKATTLALIGFEARSQQAITPLLGMGAAMREYNAELLLASGTMEDVAIKAMESFSARMTILWNRIRLVAIEIGQKLVPIIEVLVGTLVRLVELFTMLPDSIQWTIIAVAGLAAAIGPLIIAIVTLSAAWAAWGAIVAATIPEVYGAATSIMVLSRAIMVGFAWTAVVVGILAIASAIFEAHMKWTGYYEAMRKADELHGKMAQKTGVAQNKEVEELNKILDKKERLAAIEEAMKKANVESKGSYSSHVRAVDDANNNRSWIPGNKMNEARDKEAEESREIYQAKEAHAKRLIEMYKKLKEEMEAQANPDTLNALDALRKKGGKGLQGQVDSTDMDEAMGGLLKPGSFWEDAAKKVEKEIKAMDKTNKSFFSGFDSSINAIGAASDRLNAEAKREAEKKKQELARAEEERIEAEQKLRDEIAANKLGEARSTTSAFGDMYDRKLYGPKYDFSEDTKKKQKVLATQAEAKEKKAEEDAKDGTLKEVMKDTKIGLGIQKGMKEGIDLLSKGIKIKAWTGGF